MSTIPEDIKKAIDMGDSLPPNVVTGGLKHVTVVEGKENEFVSLFKELAVEVRKHDKRCNYYDLYKSKFISSRLSHLNFVEDYLRDYSILFHYL
jgi:hypothetical protein